MQNVLEVNNLCKNIDGFKLDHVSFSVPYGSIVGLVGENGAGKSTIINIILSLMHRDCGSILVFGSEIEHLDKEKKEAIGIILDENNFPTTFTPYMINNILQKTYSSWDKEVYYSYLKRFSIPERKKIKNFSRGMKVKLNLATALSHKPKLLILDEATNGLDPIIRNEILELFMEFVQNEEHAILVSSHIMSDFDKIADYITFIHNGKILFNEVKDTLKYNYCVVKCGISDIDKIDKNDIISFIKKDYEFQFLTNNRTDMLNKYSKFIVDNASIEEIMFFYIKGEKVINSGGI